jgi:hypothetical protein
MGRQRPKWVRIDTALRTCARVETIEEFPLMISCRRIPDLRKRRGGLVTWGKVKAIGTFLDRRNSMGHCIRRQFNGPLYPPTIQWATVSADTEII